MMPPVLQNTGYLNPGTPVSLGKELNRLFEESISIIVSEIKEGVWIFDTSKPPCLAINLQRIRYQVLAQKHYKYPFTEPFTTAQAGN